MSGLKVISVSGGQAVVPEVSCRLLEAQLRQVNSPTIVYFEAGWCEDCKGNAETVESFIASASGRELPHDVTLLRVTASVSRDDWKSDAGEPDWQNPFRSAPWSVASLPHAAVMRHYNSGPQVLERVVIPDTIGLNYLLERALLLRR